MANQYYDFNPSATTWALLLTGMMLFVLALSVLLIAMVYRSEARSDTPASMPEPARAPLPAAAPAVTHTLVHPVAKAS